jgi:hypothetical protein
MSRASRLARAIVVFVLVLFSQQVFVRSQAPGAVAANLQLLLGNPLFFHGRQVVVRGEMERVGDLWMLYSDDAPRGIRVVPRDTQPDSGRSEVRGQMWDIGRLSPEDPRVTTLNLHTALDADIADRWPGVGEVLVLSASSIASVLQPDAVTARNLVLEPSRFVDREVTLIGQFRGRNLYGDLPQAPAVSRWDFVLQSAGAAIWVTGQQPRGRGFNLNVTSRLDTDRWLEASGIVRERQGLVWIEASSLRLTEPAESEKPEAPPPPPMGPPPEVIFSLPLEGEIDVPSGSAIKVQFSRPMDPGSFGGRIRVSYLGEEGLSTTPPFEHDYDGGNRVLILQFEGSFERFRTVRVELLEGIAARDGAPLAPWALTFSTGSP